MSVSKIDAYRCGECLELFDTLENAEECHKPDIENLDAYQCNECETIYEERSEAKECCAE